MIKKRKQIDRIVSEKRGLKAFCVQFTSNLKKAWKGLFAIFFVFFVTFIIFPGTFFLSHFDFMKSLDSKEFTYYSLLVILTFNVGDTIGRKFGGFYQCPAQMAYFLSFLRLGFVFTTCYIA
jgi:hypothetical protein